MTDIEKIHDKGQIYIEAYSVSDTVEKQVKDVLRTIFERYGRVDLMPPVYTCLKELLVNAVKANYKNIYFEGYSPKNNSDALIDYELALKLFKLEISRENASRLERLARRANLKAEIFLYTVDDDLYITVTNPVPMTEIEINNVQRKLDATRKYKDMSEFFMSDHKSSEDEGAGLGILLISMILRNLGVNENEFIISSDNHSTTASLKIPIKTAVI